MKEKPWCDKKATRKVQFAEDDPIYIQKQPGGTWCRDSALQTGAPRSLNPDKRQINTPAQ